MGKTALKSIFGVRKPIIGALHFSPMVGHAGFSSKESVLKKALSDLSAFERGGIEGIIIENNYDLPHKIKVGPETVSMMTWLGSKIKEKANVPLGVSVLWNDYRAALSTASVIGARFVRVPVFVDSVKTDFGEIHANAKDVIAYRKSIGASEIAIFTDIQVKHAEMLDKGKPISVSARQAVEAGSDCIIVTGQWTADSPKPEKLREAKEAVGEFPVIVGSGCASENVGGLFRYADGAIISTYLKRGGKVIGERNVKPYSAGVDVRKVKEFMGAARKVREPKKR